mmetsp:Transcript_25943/g.68691  ORF Transcript_25943/g.68691 Transcript_25943/m.68691 type:complete len:256 (+) Transcript_25943:117-884(+)
MPRGAGCSTAAPPTAEVPAGAQIVVDKPQNVDVAAAVDDIAPEEIGTTPREPSIAASPAVAASISSGQAESMQGESVHPTGLAELQTLHAFSQQRAEAMFLGGGGAPKASGAPLPLQAFEMPTDGLVFLAFEAATWLFDNKGPHGRAKVQASAGEVDKQEAAAYLINDALGRPIIEIGEPGKGVHCWCMKGAFWDIGPDGRDTLIGARHTRSMRIKANTTPLGFPNFHDSFPWDPEWPSDPGKGFPILGPPRACL